MKKLIELNQSGGGSGGRGGRGGSAFGPRTSRPFPGGR